MNQADEARASRTSLVKRRKIL